MTKRKLKKLFLAQSYLDSWDEYQRSLRKSSYITWDYVILTASNEEQALAYEQQILDRLTLGLLPEKTVLRCYRIRMVSVLDLVEQLLMY